MTRTRGQQKKRAEEGIPPTPPQNLDTATRQKRSTRQTSRSASAEPKPKVTRQRGKKAKPQTITISEDESKPPAVPQKSLSPDAGSEPEAPADVADENVSMANNHVEGTSEPLSLSPVFHIGPPSNGITQPQPLATEKTAGPSLDNPWDWPESRDPFPDLPPAPAPRPVSQTARLFKMINEGTAVGPMRRPKAPSTLAKVSPAISPNATVGHPNTTDKAGEATSATASHSPVAAPTSSIIAMEPASSLSAKEISRSEIAERMFQHRFEIIPRPGRTSSVGFQDIKGVWMAVPEEAVVDIANFVANHPAVRDTRTALEIQNQLTNVVIENSASNPEPPTTPSPPAAILHTSTSPAQETASEAPVTPQARGWGLSSFIPKTVQKFLPSFRTPIAQMPPAPQPQTEPAPQKGLKRTRDTATKTSAKRLKASEAEDQEVDVEAGPVESSRQSLTLVKPQKSTSETAEPSRDNLNKDSRELEISSSLSPRKAFGPIRHKSKHSSRREEYSTSKRVLREGFKSPKREDFKDEKDFEIAKLKHLVDGWENLFDGDLDAEAVADEKQERVRKMAADPSNPFGMRSVIETMRLKKQQKEAKEQAERDEAEKEKLREQWNTWKRREKYLHFPAPANPPEWLVAEWAEEAAQEKAAAMSSKVTSAEQEDVDMNQETPRPKTPRQSKQKTPKPPSPDVIPNRPGCSYGMNEEYFVISDSDEDEDTEMVDTFTPRRSSSNVFEQQRSIEKGKSPHTDAPYEEDSTMSLGGHGPTLTFRPPSPGSSDEGDTEDEPSPTPSKNWSDQTPPAQQLEDPPSWHPSREFTRNELSVMKQREQVMKHAPKNPSRLFQSSRYSDSTIVSDDANEPPTPTPRNTLSQPAPPTPVSSYKPPTVESAKSSPERATFNVQANSQSPLEDPDATPRASAPIAASSSTLGASTTFSSFNTNNTAPTPATTFTASPPLNASPFAHSSSADAYLADVPKHVRDFVNSKWEAGGSALTAHAAKVVAEEYNEFKSLDLAESAVQSYPISQQAKQFIDQNWTPQHDQAAGADFLAEYKAWIEQGEPGLEAWKSPSAAIAASI